jgi:hypothetical protein
MGKPFVATVFADLNTAQNLLGSVVVKNTEVVEGV